MREASTIQLSPTCIHLIKEAAFARSAQLFRELQDQTETLKLMLSGYFYVDRGRVYDLEIEEPSVSVNQAGDAEFIVRFKLGTLDACADLERSIDSKMQIRLRIDLTTGKALMTGEDIPEREPDEI